MPEDRLPRHLRIQMHAFISMAFEGLVSYIRREFPDSLRMSPLQLAEWIAMNSFHTENLEALGAWYVASRAGAGASASNSNSTSTGISTSTSTSAADADADAGADVPSGGILDAIGAYGGLYGLTLDIDPHTRRLNYIYCTPPPPEPTDP